MVWGCVDVPFPYNNQPLFWGVLWLLCCCVILFGACSDVLLRLVSNCVQMMLMTLTPIYCFAHALLASWFCNWGGCTSFS